MTITFGKKTYSSTETLEAGNLIQFNYTGRTRIGVVITPDWKENCDCYMFDSLEEVPEELMEWFSHTVVDDPQDLYERFGSTYIFKSFKRARMLATQVIEYIIWEDDTEIL